MSFLDELRTRLGLSPEELERVKGLSGNPLSTALNYNASGSDNTVSGVNPNAGPQQNIRLSPNDLPNNTANDGIGVSTDVNPSIFYTPASPDQLTVKLTEKDLPINTANDQFGVSTDMPVVGGGPRSGSFGASRDFPAVDSDKPASSEPAGSSAPVTQPPSTVTMLPPQDPSEDQRRREASDAALEHKRRMGLLPELSGGVADAFASGAQGYGLSIPANTQDSIRARNEASLTKGKEDFETTLRNDPNSDISKQYQALVAELSGKRINDPSVLGLSANQIVEKIPAIEKMIGLKQQDELTRLKIAELKDAQLARIAAAKDKLDEKTQAANEKKEAALASAKEQASTIRTAIQDIKSRDLVGYDTTGAAGSRIFAPVDYTDLQEKLKTIASNIAISAIQKMRQESPTGGALGNVSDKDMELLTSIKGSLSQKQSKGQLMQTLKRLDDLYAKVEGYGSGSATAGPTETPSKSRKTSSGVSYTVGD